MDLASSMLSPRATAGRLATAQLGNRALSLPDRLMILRSQYMRGKYLPFGRNVLEILQTLSSYKQARRENLAREAVRQARETADKETAEHAHAAINEMSEQHIALMKDMTPEKRAKIVRQLADDRKSKAPTDPEEKKSWKGLTHDDIDVRVLTESQRRRKREAPAREAAKAEAAKQKAEEKVRSDYEKRTASVIAGALAKGQANLVRGDFMELVKQHMKGKEATPEAGEELKGEAETRGREIETIGRTLGLGEEGESVPAPSKPKQPKGGDKATGEKPKKPKKDAPSKLSDLIGDEGDMPW